MKAPVNVGDVLNGKYVVERVLGEGGMGVVVAARHLDLDEPVAIKFLLPELMKDPVIVMRFLREGRAAAKIRSEHVARVLDVGKLETGSPFIVMELLEGSDLAELVKAHGPLAISTAAEYFLQVCDAIAEAHSIGIVHRDIKPSNLFVTARRDGSPMVKVIDFGISKMSTGVDAGMDITKTAEMRGSLLFMSPEQMTSPKSVDPRSDIWSLGVSLHNLLTGTYPFRATTVPELCATILQREPVPLRAVRPDAPAELEVCILRCLHKSPEDRYANVGEFAAALAELAPPSARVAVERIRRLLAMTSRRTQESRPSLTEIEARISTPTVPLAARPLLDEAVDTTPMLREKPAVMAAGETTGSDGKPSSLSSVGASWGSTNPLRGGRSGSYVLLVVAAATLVSAATVSFALLALRQRQSEPATQDGFAPAGVETVIPAPARVPASDREAGASWLMEAPQAVASTAEPAGVSPGSIASGAAPKRAPRSQASSNPSIEEAHAPSFRPAVSSPSRTSPKPSASTDSRVSPEATVQATSTPPPPPPEPNTPSSVPF